jgi:hypothetical protein
LLPPVSGRNFFRFHNRHGGPPPNPGEAVSLSHPDGGGFAGQQDRIRSRGSAFRQTSASEAGAVEAAFWDHDERSIARGTFAVRPSEQQGEPGTVVIDARLAPHQGWVRMTRDDGEPEGERFYIHDELARNGAFGVIELFLGADVPEAGRLVDAEGKGLGKSLEIRFAQPQTVWRYHVFPRDNKLNFDQVRVHGGSPSFSGGQPDGVEKSSSVEIGGRTAHVFLSTGPLPIRARPIQNIELRHKPDQNSTITLVTHLPNPRLASLNYDAAQSQGPFYSDIFVHF